MNRSAAISKHMNWDDVRLFLAIAEEGSFRRGAVKLGVGHSTLSRRIDALEAELGARLFNRLSRGLTLTAAGEEMLRTAVPMGDEFSQLQLRLFGRDSETKGRINFTAPSLLVNSILMAPLEQFCAAWPDIHIDIDHSLDYRDLNAKEADIALRMTNSPSDQLIGRKVGDYCEAAYASAEYLHRFIANAENQHRWLFPGGGYQFVAQLHDPYGTSIPPQPYLTVPDPEAQACGAELGMGLAMLPCVIGDERLGLQRISNVVHRTDIWLLAHKDTRDNKRMQIFRDFLVDVFAAHQPRLLGEQSESATNP